MTIANEICQDNFIYCKTWTQNLDVKTSKKPKERVKNQCLEIIEKKKKNIWLHNRNKNIILQKLNQKIKLLLLKGLKIWRINKKTYDYVIEKI